MHHEKRDFHSGFKGKKDLCMNGLVAHVYHRKLMVMLVIIVVIIVVGVFSCTGSALEGFVVEKSRWLRWI